jgi:hypothetical protein
MTMRITAIASVLVAALGVVPPRADSECVPSGETMRVRVTLEPPVGIEVAGVVVAVSYPTATLVIPGTGVEAGRAAVSATPAGASTASEDRDGELRQVVGQATPLPPGPLFEVTFRRCEGAAPAVAGDLLCRVVDASDAKTNAIEGVRCRVAVPS